MEKKILFVCQRYGENVTGGSEAECRAYAERLTHYYSVEVLTTCALDHVSWKNELPPGDDIINGVLVHRYPTKHGRDFDAFGRLSEIIQKPDHANDQEEAWLDAQGPYCPDAIAFLRENYEKYQTVLFMTYLYYLTVRGLTPEIGNGVLVPTAHDEWMIHFNIYKKSFSAAKGLIYNSEKEKDLVEREFPDTKGKPNCIVGCGVETPKGVLPNIHDRFRIQNKYVLYAGRIEAAKGCAVMLTYFQEYKKRNPGKIDLVLIGEASMPIPKDKSIKALGFVSEEEKFALMRDAEVLIQPSALESLSIVVLESLLMGTPVLVNGYCPVLTDHCIKSNAGFYYKSFTEFEAMLNYLLSRPSVYQQMQANGKAYVEKYYQWSYIIDQIYQLIERVTKRINEILFSEIRNRLS